MSVERQSPVAAARSSAGTRDAGPAAELEPAPAAPVLRELGRAGWVLRIAGAPRAQQIVLIFISQGQTNYAYQNAKLHNRVSSSPSFRCVQLFHLPGLCSRSCRGFRAPSLTVNLLVQPKVGGWTQKRCR